LERALELLAALEALRALGRRTRLLPRELVERLLQLPGLLGDLLERGLGGLLLLIHVLIEIGERGEAQLERGAHRAPRPRDQVVVEQLEPEAGALPRQQRERGRIPVRLDVRLARLSVEAGERQVGPRRRGVLAELELELRQPE